MNTTLKRSLENAIVLFLLSIVSALIVDYQMHGYPPSPGVIYISLLTAFFAFLTTMATQANKNRKKAKEKKESTTSSEISSEHNSPSEIIHPGVPDPPGELEGSGTTKKKEDDWLLAMVI